jgi:RHS repeat-associated protein
MAKANPFRFSTKYQDDETDLLYYGFRYYNTCTGKWLSRDPASEAADSNLYCPIKNALISAFDVLGLCGGEQNESCPCKSEKTPVALQITG